MFIGRERELASLKEFYDKDGVGMTVIYGRRRIGKSTLITEFVKDKKTIFYLIKKYHYKYEVCLVYLKNL